MGSIRFVTGSRAGAQAPQRLLWGSATVALMRTLGPAALDTESQRAESKGDLRRNVRLILCCT